MKSRAARLALLVMFVVTLGVTAYLFKKGDAERREETAAAEAFSASARTAARGTLELRAAQQAYVATGQADDFWASRVSTTLGTLRDRLTSLRTAATSADAKTHIDTAAGSLDDFAQMDRRASEYVRSGQKVVASDLIFSNGGELTDAAVVSIDKAVTSELTARAASVATFERRQDFALIAAAAAAALVVLLLLPRVQGDLPSPAFLEQSVPVGSMVPTPIRPADATSITYEGWSSPKRINEPAQPEAPAVSEPPASQTPAAAEPAPQPAAVAAPVPVLDFKAIASLCTELSRVDDTMALSPLLERAASLLDAAGIILWIADPDGRELNPVLAQGYPQHLVNRLGTIPRGAENATAAAYRTGLLQTVYADGISNGAIAAPLLTCGGCVGVMAAEVKGDTEKQEANLAAATILAAQLASLVGPPAGRSSDANVEAANA
jgi:hypothetical protein